MPLTGHQKVILSEILDIPDTARLVVLDAYYGAGRTTMSPAITSAIAELDTELALLNADQVTRVAALIAEYEEIATDPTSIEEGGAQSASGLRMSAENQRALIRDRVLIHVPVFRQKYWQLKAMMGVSTGATGGTSQPIMRG